MGCKSKLQKEYAEGAFFNHKLGNKLGNPSDYFFHDRASSVQKFLNSRSTSMIKGLVVFAVLLAEVDTPALAESVADLYFGKR